MVDGDSVVVCYPVTSAPSPRLPGVCKKFTARQRSSNFSRLELPPRFSCKSFPQVFSLSSPLDD